MNLEQLQQPTITYGGEDGRPGLNITSTELCLTRRRCIGPPVRWLCLASAMARSQRLPPTLVCGGRAPSLALVAVRLTPDLHEDLH